MDINLIFQTGQENKVEVRKIEGGRLQKGEPEIFLQKIFMLNTATIKQ